MTPKKYPQNLHTPKNIHFFWKPPKILKFKILNPKRPEPPCVWKYQSMGCAHRRLKFVFDGRSIGSQWFNVSLGGKVNQTVGGRRLILVFAVGTGPEMSKVFSCLTQLSVYKVQVGMCAHRRLKSLSASPLSDQSIWWALFG